MAIRTQSDPQRSDYYGIERAHDDDPGMVDRVREKAPVVDHLLRMNERYTTSGGNQFAAGITYFSVLAMFPLLMLVFAILGAVLARNPDYMAQIREAISGFTSGSLGDTINQIIDTAIAQRGAIASIGTLAALWSGLGWMNNLRYGVSKMWHADPTDGSFLGKKLADLLGLIGLLLAFVIAFGVTAIGSSGLTQSIISFLGLDAIPGIWILTRLVALVLGLLANFLVFLWLIMYLPRTQVPKKSGIYGALIGAVAMEVIKQIASLFFSNALANPAGAVFGPIIGLMVVMYLIWRVLLYCSAWAATTEESLALTPLPAPSPAVIRVRNEVHHGPQPTTVLGVGAALGAVGTGILTLLSKRK